jgi:hypothetical protein
MSIYQIWDGIAWIAMVEATTPEQASTFYRRLCGERAPLIVQASERQLDNLVSQCEIIRADSSYTTAANMRELQATHPPPRRGRQN